MKHVRLVILKCIRPVDTNQVGFVVAAQFWHKETEQVFNQIAKKEMFSVISSPHKVIFVGVFISTKTKRYVSAQQYSALIT